MKQPCWNIGLMQHEITINVNSFKSTVWNIIYFVNWTLEEKNNKDYFLCRSWSTFFRISSILHIFSFSSFNSFLRSPSSFSVSNFRFLHKFHYEFSYLSNLHFRKLCSTKFKSLMIWIVPKVHLRHAKSTWQQSPWLTEWYHAPSGQNQ